MRLSPKLLRTPHGTLGLVLLLAAPSLLAQGIPASRPDSAQMAAMLSNGMRMLHPAELVLGHATELGLTPDQTKRLKQLAAALDDSTAVRQRRRMVAMEAAYADMARTGTPSFDLKWTGPIDEQAIRQRTMRQVADMAEITIEMMRDRHAVGAILTPVQIAMLERMQNPVLQVGRRDAQPLQTSPDGIYFEFQVEKRVAQIPGTLTLIYPQMLRTARDEGSVLAQFIVDTTGHFEPGSLKILRSSHELFTQSVKDALPTMRFMPAEVGGHKVRQLVQQPFTFSLASEK